MFSLSTAFSAMLLASICLLHPQDKPQVIFGIFLASIEEGARIFTPVRLLPFEHPEAEGHEFPNALELHQSEYETLVHLGEQVGLKLQATLQRYPTRPVDDWWYSDLARPPVETIKKSSIKNLSVGPAIPGLRAVAIVNGRPVCFIVDTRGLSLEARGMQRATSMGLDLTRQKFLDGLLAAASSVSSEGAWIVVFSKARSVSQPK